MQYLGNFISSRLFNIDFASPLAFFDLLISLVLIVFFLGYIRKFPVFRVVLGVLLLFLCSVVFSLVGFQLTALLFGFISSLVLVSLPFIFAPEVRHYLEKLGRLSFLKLPSWTEKQKNDVFINNLISAVYELAERRVGATLVLQRKTGLGETIETGVLLDARFGSKLLESIFFAKSPLHDGAVVIKGGRILAAKCLLPISGEVKLDPPFGTRHKSGLAITKDTDAVVIIISEQRGEVSLAENGKLEINLDRAVLANRLNKML